MGKGGGGPAGAGAGTGQEGRHAGVARSRHAPTHRPHQSDQAQQRFRRPSRATRSALWSQAGQPTKPVILVEDNGPIHTSKLSMAALAARAHWLTVECLPKYAPELNDMRWSGTTSRRITWHIRHLPTLTRWTGRSTTPWTNSMQSARRFRWPNHESLP